MKILGGSKTTPQHVVTLTRFSHSSLQSSHSGEVPKRSPDFAEALIDGVFEVGDVRLEFGELNSERKVLLLSVEVDDVDLGANDVELLEHTVDEGVGLCSHEGAVVGASRELLVREEERHQVLCANRREFEKKKRKVKEKNRSGEKEEKKRKEKKMTKVSN